MTGTVQSLIVSELMLASSLASAVPCTHFEILLTRLNRLAQLPELLGFLQRFEAAGVRHHPISRSSDTPSHRTELYMLGQGEVLAPSRGSLLTTHVFPDVSVLLTLLTLLE